MELKNYLNLLIKRWWLVLPSFLITFTTGIVFTYIETPLYSAATTYVVVPSASFGVDTKNFANGLDLLGRRAEIATTFTEIASSQKIKELTLKSLSLKSGREYSINSDLRRSSNIIEITVTGPDPMVVRDLANGVGDALEQYVQGLYEVFTLISLDQATTPTSPVSPKVTNNLVLAAIIGLVLGGGLAFLAEYLEKPLGLVVSMNIIDNETGVYNQEYFSRRLGEEMVRAKRNRYPLSLALMRIDNLSFFKGTDSAKVHTELLRKIAVLTGQYLREEDIVAYLENDVFGLLLPDMLGENAKALMEYLQTRIAWTPFESVMNGSKLNLKGIVGITTYNHNGTSRDELMAQATRALQLAAVEDGGKVFLMIDPSSGETYAS